jgi:hypothetical protein
VNPPDVVGHIVKRQAAAWFSSFSEVPQYESSRGPGRSELSARTFRTLGRELSLRRRPSHVGGPPARFLKRQVGLRLRVAMARRYWTL